MDSSGSPTATLISSRDKFQHLLISRTFAADFADIASVCTTPRPASRHLGYPPMPEKKKAHGPKTVRR